MIDFAQIGCLKVLTLHKIYSPHPAKAPTSHINAPDESRRSSPITLWEFLSRISLGELDAYPEH